MHLLSVFCFLILSSVWALPSPKKQSIRFPLRAKGPRIINGEAASPGQFPWQAALFIEDNDSTWFCGGSLISEDWILTAGHCVIGGISGVIFTGSVDPLEGYISLPNQFVLHEDYEFDGENLKNDIGLIRLTFPLTFDATTAAIPLSNDTLEDGTEVTAIGWGLTSDNAQTISDVLNYVQLTTISNDQCQATYPDEDIRDEMVCATSFTDLNRGVCSGDSGGGLVINADTNPEHAAISSFVSDEGCENGLPNGFTRTAYYRDWIRRHTGI